MTSGEASTSPSNGDSALGNHAALHAKTLSSALLTRSSCLHISGTNLAVNGLKLKGATQGIDAGERVTEFQTSASSLAHSC